jgi:hypothetical protein
VPPPVDPGAGAPRLGGPEVPPLLPPSAANEVSPMETAMRRAVNDPSAVEGVRPVDPGIATMPPRGPVDMPPIPFNSPQPRVAPPPVDPAVIRTSPNLRVTPRPRLNLRF